MTVSATDSSTASAVSSSLTSSISETQDRFLKLLITQLENQDPLNPMDNAEMTTQLAQMSTVEGIAELNDNFTTLLSNLQSYQGVQAASMLGHDVMVPGNTLVSDGSGGQGGVQLDSAVDSLVVTIRDANGQLVQTVDLGAQSAGFVQFAWDGLDSSGAATAAGTYTYSVAAKSAGSSVGATAYAANRVSGVYLTDSGVELDVEGMGSYALSDVQQIL